MQVWGEEVEGGGLWGEGQPCRYGGRRLKGGGLWGERQPCRYGGRRLKGGGCGVRGSRAGRGGGG